jgi:hypothetical protein
VTFFVRIKQAHGWQSPGYKFNRRQDRAFRRLITTAEQSVVKADDISDVDTESTSSSDEQAMTELHSACLSFCIELLNQKIYNYEYGIALICALATLGVSLSGTGFRGADTYPSILSVVIKVAHFMVV